METICHWMEEILSIAANERLVLERSRLDLLLSAADAIRNAADLLEGGEIPSPRHGEHVVEKLEVRRKRASDDGLNEGAPSSVLTLSRRSPFAPPTPDGSMRVSARAPGCTPYRSGEMLTFNCVMRRHAGAASSLRGGSKENARPGSDPTGQVARVESGLRQLAAFLRQDVCA